MSRLVCAVTLVRCAHVARAVGLADLLLRRNALAVLEAASLVGVLVHHLAYLVARQRRVALVEQRRVRVHAGVELAGHPQLRADRLQILGPDIRLLERVEERLLDGHDPLTGQMDAVQALADDVVVYLDESTGELAVGIRLEVDLAGVLLTGGDLVELGKRDTWQRHECGPFLKPWLFSPFTPDTPIGYKDVRLFPAVSLHLHEVADGQITRRIAAGRNVGLEAGDKVAPGSGGLGEAG